MNADGTRVTDAPLNADVAEVVLTNEEVFSGKDKIGKINYYSTYEPIIDIKGNACGAYFAGIPTSESHALIAGLTGGAIALHGGLTGVNGAEWVKVIYGLVISVFFFIVAIHHLLVCLIRLDTVARVWRLIDRYQSHVTTKPAARLS